MNSFKTAFLNVRKCSKDYSVYFFTLIVGVAIFFMFNSVGSQGFMESMVSSQSSTMQSLVQLINFISVGVAVIFGLLMVYANNFLIRRRKKEFGVYMMLGMSRKRVAGILSIETLLVGILSLGVGIIVGILGSQLLSFAVAKMFAADLSSLRFIFSIDVLLKTVLYFAIMFLVVLIFNAKSMAKYKLIDLLNARKSAEKKLIKNSIVSVVIFILGLVSLVFAYYEVGFRGEELMKQEMLICFAAGLFGTFALFFGLSGFLPQFLKRFKKMYYDRLNAFVSSQFGHNLNSSAVSFAVISIMLFLAIAAFSVGFSMNGYLNNRLKNATPVDISADYMMKDRPENDCGSVSELLEEKGYDANEILEDYCEVTVYHSPYFVMKSPLEANFEAAQNVFMQAHWDAPEYVVRLSEYNKLERMYGRDELELTDNQYAVVCDFDSLEELINGAIDKGNVINVGDKALTSGYDACIYEYVIMSGTTATMGVIVVPDSLIEGMPQDFEEVGSILSGNYSTSLVDSGLNDVNVVREATVAAGDALFEKVYSELPEDAGSLYSTATYVKENSVGTSVTVVFVVLYIGIVFIITSAAVIALKILSDSMDSVEKFSILRRVGADRKMCNNALFAQTLFNFALPLLVGLLDAIFGLRYAKGLLKSFGMGRMFNGTIVAVCVMILVYGAYFLITFLASKRIVLEER